MHEPVPCAICQRTILRGESPDVFLHGGRRAVVCELCVPRAVHEGWIREGADAAPGRATRGWTRRGSGRSLIERLRARGYTGSVILEGWCPPDFDDAATVAGELASAEAGLQVLKQWLQT